LLVFEQSISHVAPFSQRGKQSNESRQSISQVLLPRQVVSQLAVCRQSNLHSHGLLSHENVVQVPPGPHSSSQHVDPLQSEHPTAHTTASIIGTASMIDASMIDAPSMIVPSVVEPSPSMVAASIVLAASEAWPSRTHLPSTHTCPLGQPNPSEQRKFPS